MWMLQLLILECGCSYTPLARGFDEHLGYLSGEIEYYTHLRNDSLSNGYVQGQRVSGGLDWNRGNCTPSPADDGNYTTPLIVDAASRFIAKHTRRPFFLYLPFHLVHSPSEVPPRFLQR